MGDEMSKWRVWPKDEFDGCRDADERDDGAIELRLDRSVWSLTRVGRVLHCPYTIEGRDMLVYRVTPLGWIVVQQREGTRP